jgi:hypothetical protein
MKKPTKKTIVFFFLFLLIFPIAFVVATSLSPVNLESKIYLLSGDIIKNFNFEQIGTEPIENGYAFNNKIVFESEPVWTLEKNDVQLVYSLVVDNDDGTQEVKMYYKLPMTQKINIYTNLDLYDACEKLEEVTDTYQVASWSHYDYWGTLLNNWKTTLDWTHYNFGESVKAYNEQHNVFKGDVKMTFDIQQTPLPNIFQDDDGRDIRKKFDYISVSSAAVKDNTHGKLNNDVPSFVNIEPSEYDSKKSDHTEEEAKETYGHLEVYDPNTEFGQVFESEVFDAGILPHTVDSSMNPTTKAGGPVWEPTNNESMKNCLLRYRLGSLSPIVKEYSQTLKFTRQAIGTSNYLVSLIPWTIGVKVDWDNEDRQSITQPVGLQVTNRYIQTEIQVVFDIWTSYEITPLENEAEDYDLEKPQEYYDEVAWSSVVDGFGGGQSYGEGATTNIFDGPLGILIIILIIAVSLIGLYVVYRIYKKRGSFASK